MFVVRFKGSEFVSSIVHIPPIQQVAAMPNRPAQYRCLFSKEILVQKWLEMHLSNNVLQGDTLSFLVLLPYLLSIPIPYNLGPVAA